MNSISILPLRQKSKNEILTPKHYYYEDLLEKKSFFNFYKLVSTVRSPKASYLLGFNSVFVSYSCFLFFCFWFRTTEVLTELMGCLFWSSSFIVKKKKKRLIAIFLSFSNMYMHKQMRVRKKLIAPPLTCTLQRLELRNKWLPSKQFSVVPQAY